MTTKQFKFTETVLPVLSDTLKNCKCCHHPDGKHLYGINYDDLNNTLYDILYDVASHTHKSFSVTITVVVEE